MGRAANNQKATQINVHLQLYVLNITDETYMIPLELKIEGFGIIRLVIRLTLGKNNFRHNRRAGFKVGQSGHAGTSLEVCCGSSNEMMVA